MGIQNIHNKHGHFFPKERPSSGRFWDFPIVENPKTRHAKLETNISPEREARLQTNPIILTHQETSTDPVTNHYEHLRPKAFLFEVVPTRWLIPSYNPQGV